MPFAYILVSKKVFDFIKNQHVPAKRSMGIILAILLVWIIAEPVMNYPNYLSYFNESIGGSKNGYNYVTDSNTDWGQDLKRLKVWLDQHPEIDKIRLDYFGGGDVDYYLSGRYIPWSDDKRPIEQGWYAISANYRQGSIFNTKDKTPENSYAWTEQYQPVTIIGNSILIYHIEKTPITQ